MLDQSHDGPDAWHSNRSDKVRLGSLTPAKDGFLTDRARIGLSRSVDVKPLKIDRLSKYMKKGDDVLLVSLQPPNMTLVYIQKCQVMAAGKTEVPSQPRLLATDCDTDPGNSGGLYLWPMIEGANDHPTYFPVAINEGHLDDLGDYKSWDYFANSPFGIQLDEDFSKNLKELP